jgi:hypothetical protein
MWIRLLIIWVGSALGGSSLGSVAVQLYDHGAWSVQEMRHLVGFAVATLLWTLPGSALLFLIFSALRGRGLSTPWSLVLLVILGAAAGALMLCLIGLRTDNIVTGALFGLTTTTCWVALSSATGGLRLARPAA